MTTVAPQVAFAALRLAPFRSYVLVMAAAMMADSIEHVISYWVAFQHFHSPALGGFAVLSHWLPFLLLSVKVGALADHLDARRLIQLGLVVFSLVSVAWGVLFVTDTLTVWNAGLLLALHGIAGVLWNVAGQVYVQRVVPPEVLPSAVRLTASARYLGMLAGPAVGAALMLAAGPIAGIFLNALLYLPGLAWLQWRAAAALPGSAPRPGLRGLNEVLATLRQVRGDARLMGMLLLGGITSLLVGNAYQAQMPGFAQELGHANADFTYSLLLAADAAGALAAGLILEVRSLPLRPNTGFTLALLWCAALSGFALSHSYVLALPLLFAAGFLELGFNSIAQTLVQLNAPAEIRGRVIGLYAMAALGLRGFSGLSVGVLGAAVGIHLSLAGSALSVAVLLVACWLWVRTA